MKKNISDRFIPNFHIELLGGLKPNDEQYTQLSQAVLERLDAIITCPEDNAFLINIYPHITDDEKETQETFGEQSRMGGYGKTMLLKRCLNKVPKNSLKGTKSENTFPIIELDEQYNTKENILKKIVENIAYLDPSLKETVLKRFYKTVITVNESETEKSDPSYLAERQFDELGKEWKNKKPQGHFFLCFDAFDAQYLGKEYSPLRIWLTDSLFPYLIKEMNINLIVAGREKISLKEIDIPRHDFVLDTFRESQLIEYMTQKYNETAEWENHVNNISKANRDYLLDRTDGKPIFIDFFCNLAYRECMTSNGKSPRYPNINELIESIQKEETVENKQSIVDNLQAKAQRQAEQVEEIDNNRTKVFKRYLINRLHLLDTQDMGKETVIQIAEAIKILSLARHGLTAEEFADLESLGEYSSFTKAAHVQRIETFYTTYFVSDQEESDKISGFSYVKNRKTPDGKQVRLLHDEVVDLFLKYWYDEFDKDHEERNNYLRYLRQMRDEQLVVIEKKGEKDTDDDYAKLLLEYLEYALMYRSRGEEISAINRLLYEFSYFLDRHPDLSSRLLEKGNKYYSLKKKHWEEKREGKEEQTLTFAKDFTLLFKLRMRESEYCLTERGAKWEERIKDVLDELLTLENPKSKFYQQKKIQPIQLTHLDRLGLGARSLNTEGESKFWKGQWDKGKANIRLSKEYFYATGDSPGLIWAEHLLGFEAQRSGEFKRAAQHHINAITNAIEHFAFLSRYIQKKEKNKSDVPNKEQKLQSDTDTTIQNIQFDFRYRLRFLLKTLNRANSNWAVNLRYRGKILEAIKILENNLEIADIVGIREEVRVKANLSTFYAIRGVMSEHENYLKIANEGVTKIKDAMLHRRLCIARLTGKIKELGLDNIIYTELIINILHNKSEDDQLTAILEDLKANIPSPQPLLSLEGTRKSAQIFKVTDRLDADSLMRWFKTNTPNREIGDMYYLYGKAVLSIGYGLEEKYFFEEAIDAFENARLIAHNATFRYLEMECCEILYRISFLSKLSKKVQNDYRDDFIKHQQDINKHEDDYGVYHDLLAKFYLTEGDVALEQFQLLSYPDPPALTHVLSHYAQALYHSHRHNQERFLLVLTALTQRIEVIFQYIQHDAVTHEFARYISAFFEKQIIHREDSTFGLFLNTLLKAKSIEIKSDKNPDISIFLMNQGKN